MIKTIHELPAAYVMTVSVTGGTAHARRADDATVGGIASVGSNVTFGPYQIDRKVVVTGVANVAVAASDTAAATASAVAIIAAIPATDQEDSATVWNDVGVLKVSTAP